MLSQGVSLSYRVNLVQVLAYDVIQLLVVHVYVNGYDIAAIGHDGVDTAVAQRRKHGPQYPVPLPALHRSRFLRLSWI